MVWHDNVTVNCDVISVMREIAARAGGRPGTVAPTLLPANPRPYNSPLPAYGHPLPQVGEGSKAHYPTLPVSTIKL